MKCLNNLFLFWLIAIPVTSGLNCYKCGYLKNLDGIPISLPGLPLLKDCKEGDLSSDLLKQCPAMSGPYVCGKVKATASNDVEIYLKGCVSKSSLPATYADQCKDLSIGDAIKIVEDMTGETITFPPGSEPAFNIHACNCGTEGCNSAAGISVDFACFISIVGILANNFL